MKRNDHDEIIKAIAAEVGCSTEEVRRAHSIAGHYDDAAAMSVMFRATSSDDVDDENVPVRTVLVPMRLGEAAHCFLLGIAGTAIEAQAEEARHRAGMPPVSEVAAVELVAIVITEELRDILTSRGLDLLPVDGFTVRSDGDVIHRASGETSTPASHVASDPISDPIADMMRNITKGMNNGNDDKSND